MPSEKLSLSNVGAGISVHSESDKLTSGRYLITITPNGRVLAEHGVTQEDTNFNCNEENERVVIY